MDAAGKPVRRQLRPEMLNFHTKIASSTGCLVVPARVLVWLAGLALTAGLLAVVQGHAASERAIDIEIRSGKVAGKNAARVIRGDSVQLRWKSDAPVELHLHGYNLTVHVRPGAPAAMKFKAHATGRFPVEIHADGKSSGGHGHGHKPVFFLEVYPD